MAEDLDSGSDTGFDDFSDIPAVNALRCHSDTVALEKSAVPILVHCVSGRTLAVADEGGRTVDDVVQELADRIGVPASQLKLFREGLALDSTLQLAGGDVLNVVVRRAILVAWATDAVELSIHNADSRLCVSVAKRQSREKMHACAICVDWNSMHVLTGFSDGMVSCFKIQEDGSVQRQAVLSEHSERIARIEMSENIALTVSIDGGLGVIDLRTYAMDVYELSLHTDALFADFEHGLVLTGGANPGDASCWQIPLLPALEEGEDDISCVLNLMGCNIDRIKMFCADFTKGVVLGGGYCRDVDGAFAINVWNQQDPFASSPDKEPLQVSEHFIIGGEGGKVVHVEASLQAGMVISGHESGKLVVWRIVDGTQMFQMQHSKKEISNLAADFDSQRLVSVDVRTVCLWDLLTGMLLVTVSAAGFDVLLSKSICADLISGIVLLGTYASGLLFFDLFKGDYFVLEEDNMRTYGAIAARLPARPCASSITSLNTNHD